MCTSGEYGDSCAEFYDQLYGPCRRQVIDVLTAYANHGNVLELGVGTGRTAVPLARQGVQVAGIESSSRMLAKLQHKPGGELIRTLHGDFATANLGGKFDLIFALCSTIHLLPSYMRQLACFRNVSRYLAPQGSFLVEASIPEPWNPALPSSIDHQRRIHETLPLMTQMGVCEYRLDLFRTTPAQLDKMAETAGLKLNSRWSNWHRAPFIPATSHSHISIYQPAL